MSRCKKLSPTGEQRADKEKSHKIIWWWECPGSVPGINSGRPRDIRDVGADLCGNSHSRGRMSAGQTGQMTGQMGHVHGTDGTQTRGCPAKILYVYWFFFPHCLETIFESQLPSPKLSPEMPPKLSLAHKRGNFFSFKINPAVRVTARQLKDKNCLAAISDQRHQDVSSGPLGDPFSQCISGGLCLCWEKESIHHPAPVRNFSLPTKKGATEERFW